MKELTQRLSVLLASDFPMLRDRMIELLNSVPELRVVASTDADSEVLDLARVHKPSVALLDLSVEWAALCEIVTGLHSDKVLPMLMGEKLDDQQAVELLRRGVCGFLPRRTTPEILRKSVRAIGSGEIWITRHTVGKVLEQVREVKAPATAEPLVKSVQVSESVSNRYNLTRREMQMVQALAEGMTNKDIASEFGISESTVKHHLTSIFDKVGVDSRLELATFAAYHGLVGAGETVEVAASQPA